MCKLNINLYVIFNFFTQLLSASPPDSLSVDTNKLWFDKSNHIMFGFGSDYKNIDLRFKNNSANLIGNLQFDYTSAGFKYKVTDWRFYPNINQSFVSVFAKTKYGSLALSKAINPVNNENITKSTALSFSFPIKKFDISFDYLKLTGLNRIEPVYNTQKFLKEMTFNPISLNVNWHFFGKLKNHFLYVPKKGIYSASLVLSGLMVTLNNPTDFIPILKYKNNLKNDSIVQVEGVYLKKFTSTGGLIGVRYDFLVPIIKGKSKIKVNTLYLKATAMYGINFQNYVYKSIADTLNSSVQFKVSRKGFGATANYFLAGTLVYDVDLFVIGIGASYNQLNYGSGNTTSLESINNHVSDTRTYYNAFISYRIGIKKWLTKIDAQINKI